MNIDNLRTSHWDEAIQEIKGTGPNRTLASECYHLWKSTRLKCLAIPDPVKSMLAELRKTYKLLLLTNGDTQTQREKIRAVGCQELFDAVIVGGEHAEEKPATSIFLHCCEILGVKPESCVMVGDSVDTDIQGGINAGFKATVWISKTAVTAEAARPHYTVPTVLDVTTILNNMNQEPLCLL
ncbi:NANP phosphatase, partial [Polyodon spathula]|nr:NANP phosphatase [Polyodon spathula]